MARLIIKQPCACALHRNGRHYNDFWFDWPACVYLALLQRYHQRRWCMIAIWGYINFNMISRAMAYGARYLMAEPIHARATHNSVANRYQCLCCRHIRDIMWPMTRNLSTYLTAIVFRRNLMTLAGLARAFTSYMSCKWSASITDISPSFTLFLVLGTISAFDEVTWLQLFRHRYQH